MFETFVVSSVRLFRTRTGVIGYKTVEGRYLASGSCNCIEKEQGQRPRVESCFDIIFCRLGQFHSLACVLRV